MTDEKKENSKTEPKKISRAEADRLNNYAQGLDDKVTHVVDYGEGLGEEKEDNG